MDWLDLMPGDVVIPIDITHNLWLVLEVTENLSPPRHCMMYICLGSGKLCTTTTGTDGFNLGVQIIRDGKNVNR